MKRLFISFTALLFAACTSDTPKPEGAERTIPERTRAVCAMHHAVAGAWRGCDAPKDDVPMLCCAVDPTPELRGHFGVRPAHEEPGLRTYRMARPDAQSFHMETSLEFGDPTHFAYLRPYLRCSSPEITVRTVPDVISDSVWIPMMFHEYAHGYPYAHRTFCKRVADALPTHSETEHRTLRRQYERFDRAIRAGNRALLGAPGTGGTAHREQCIRRFLTPRAERKARMSAELGADAVRDEEFFELMAGMARHVEAEAGFRLGSYAETDAWLHDTDRSGHFYATGCNLVRLLVRTGAACERLFADMVRPLEYYLQTTRNDNR